MNSLNDDEFRDLPPRERRYEIQVADNLFFAVFPNGVKTWVLVYRFEGLVRRQTLGTFPDMRLAQALREADKAPEPAPRRPEPDPRVRRKAGRHWWLAAAVVGILGAGFAYLAAGSRAEAAARHGTPAAPACELSQGTRADSGIPPTGPVSGRAITRLSEPDCEPGAEPSR